MLLWLTEVLSQYFSALTVFQYLTVRVMTGRRRTLAKQAPQPWVVL